MDLAKFLAARLDEDEAAAKGVAGRPEFDGTGIVIQRNKGADRSVVMPSHVAIHIARHDAARVLREVAAKRAILAEHEPEPWRDPHPELSRCAPGHGDGGSGWWTTWPCIEVRAIAAVYSDHPDYQQEWKP